MTRAEFEKRKQVLEEQFRASILFLREGYESQLRALESDGSASTGSVPGRNARADAAVVAEPARRRARGREPGEMTELVRAAVDQLPAELTKEDIVRILGFSPERSSLHRALDVLLVEGTVGIHVRGAGRKPNVYRKLSGKTAGA